jgi:hypothetical protein
MPVFKYKTFMEARKALWNLRPDENYYKELEQLWETADRLCPIRYPSGVFKYRDISKANKQKQEWDIAHGKRMLCEMDEKPNVYHTKHAGD